jgi:hypothetical protein
MGRACITNGEKRNAHRIMVPKPEGKRRLGRPICRFMDKNKADIRGRGQWGMDWVDLAQDWDQWRALVNMVMSLSVSQNAEKLLRRWTPKVSQEGLNSMDLVQ